MSKPLTADERASFRRYAEDALAELRQQWADHTIRLLDELETLQKAVPHTLGATWKRCTAVDHQGHRCQRAGWTTGGAYCWEHTDDQMPPQACPPDSGP